MKRLVCVFTIILSAAILLVNQSCNDKNDNNGGNPSGDNVSPKVSITSPTADFSYLADGNTISLAGSASDNVGLTEVVWKGPGGTGGTATGTESWTVSNLSLANGDNLFTIIAHDAAHNADTAMILVTYNEFLNFITPLHVNPNGFYVNTSADVTFSISVLNDPDLVANSITLIKVDELGNMIEEVFELFDDGDLAHGDDILGDGVYSNIQNLFESNPSQMNFRVRATTSETSGNVDSYSEIATLKVVDEISSETAQAVLSIQTEAEAQFQVFLQTLAFDAAVAQTIAYLEQQPMVVSASITGSGDIWIEFEYGLEGMIFTTLEGNEGGSGGKKERDSKATIPLSLQTRGIGINYSSSAEGDENVVLDKDVLLYAPNWTEFNGWGTEFLDNIVTIYENSECPNFNINYVKNGDADLDVLKTLSEYGTIIIHTHGGLDPDNNVIFLTGQEVDDWDLDKLLEWAIGRIYPIPFHGKSMWVVKPSFITAYNGTYPNSIVYNGSCESAHNNTMANVFINNGANTYFGFSETVQSSFDRDKANELFPELVDNGLKTGEAFIPNQHDGSTPAAYFVMIGNAETHYASGFINGDFEEGNLSGWAVDGDGRIITQLAYIAPNGGSYMGIISTGLGFTLATGSISQNFCVPLDATTLSLSWNFLSEEFEEYVGSIYMDYFQISIIDDQGSENMLFYQSIDDIWYGYSPTLVSPDIVFDIGDVYGTGWQFFTVDISAYAGMGVTLVLSAGDVGDSIYDTAILLDDIVVQ